MSTVELIAVEIEPAANTAPRVGARATAARGFVIQVVAREVTLLERGADWLRAAGRQLAWSDQAACERLASQGLALREQLLVLAQHLVARWNQLDRRGRLQVAALLDQSNQPSGPFAELVELHERHATGPTPWLELAVLRPVEQMLAGVVPLAIDVAAVDDGDLAAAALLFGAREQRARELERLLARMVARLADADPQQRSRRSAMVAEVEEQSISIFTKLLSECAKVGRELDCWRHGFVR